MLIVVNRFRVAHGPGGPGSPGSSAGEDGFRRGLQDAWALLASKPGYAGGEMGRNLDDPTLWVLTTRWENVGSYRRALSAYDVKLNSDKTNNVGFLFLTDDFIKTLTPNPANADISTDGPGDGKFPKGAWASSLVAALSTLLSTEQAERLNPAQRKAMRALLEVL